MAAVWTALSKSAAGDHRDVAEGLGRGRTYQPDWCSSVAIRDRARSLIADRPRHHARLDQRRKSRRFRGDEPRHLPHRLRPVIDRTFPFAEAKEAYRHFEGRGHFGKVVITHG
jgi:Zinc-binding dehydrogenase